MSRVVSSRSSCLARARMEFPRTLVQPPLKPRMKQKGQERTGGDGSLNICFTDE